jgi:hypothetical protein
MSIGEALHALFGIGGVALVAVFLRKKGIPWLVSRTTQMDRVMAKTLADTGLTLVEGRVDDFALMGLQGFGRRARLVSASDSHHLEVNFRSIRPGELNVWLDMNPRSLWDANWSGWNRYPVYRGRFTVRESSSFRSSKSVFESRKDEAPSGKSFNRCWASDCRGLASRQRPAHCRGFHSRRSGM